MADKDSLFRNATEYCQQGKWDKAIDIYKKILKIDPENITVFNLLGDAYIGKNEIDKGYEEYKKASLAFESQGLLNKAIAVNKKILRIKPNEIDIYIKIADIYAQLGLIGEANEQLLKVADIYIQNKDINKLLDIYKKIVELNPKNIKIRLRLIKMYLKENLFDQAVSEYIKIAEYYKENSSIDEAISLLESAKTELPKYIAINQVLANYYIEKKLIDKALTEIQYVLSIQPNNKELFLELCKIFLDLGKIDELIILHENFIINQPDNIEIAIKLANLYIQTSKLDKAEILLTNVIKKDNKNIDVHKEYIDLLIKLNKKEDLLKEYKIIGDLYFENNLLDRAEEYFLKVILINKNDIATTKSLVNIYESQGKKEKLNDYYFILGNLEEKEGKKEDAINYFKKIEPVTPEVLDKLQNLYHLLKKQQEEIDILNTILKTNQDDIKVLEKLANIYFEMKQYDNAEQLFKSILTLNPYIIKIHERLAEIYIKQNKVDLAITELRSLLDQDPANMEIRSRLSELEQKILSDKPIDVSQIDAEIKNAFIDQLSQNNSMSLATPKESVSNFLHDARTLISHKQIEKAIELYKKVLSLEFENEEANVLLKEIAPSRYKQICEEVKNNKNITIEPQETIKKSKPKFLDEKIEEESLENIIANFKSGVTEDIEEEDFESHYNLGIAYKEMGLLDDAIEEFKIAANKDENIVQCYGLLGICYMEKGIFDMAIKYFILSMAHPLYDDLSYRWIKYDLALSYKKNGIFDKAFETFKEVERVDEYYRDVKSEIESIKKLLDKKTSDNTNNTSKSKISYI